MSLVVKIAVVAVGGALGALSRTGLTEIVARVSATGDPYGGIWGTATVNVVGCFLMGLARGAFELAGWSSVRMQAFLFSGFLGAFTTFSTFEANTVTLWRSGERFYASLYMGGSVACGLAAFLAGRGLLMTSGS